MNSELKQLERERKFAVSHNKWKEAADKCNCIGAELSRLGRHEKALLFHKDELSYNARIGYQLGIAIANRKIGECYSVMNDFEKALSHILTFKKISVDLGDIVEEQRAWATLGRTFYLKYMDEQDPGDLENSQKAYVKALKLIDVVKSKLSEKELAEMKSRCLLNLGLVYEEKGKIQECVKCIQIAIFLAQKFGLHEDLNRCQSSLASVYQKHGQYAKALELMEGAIASATKLHDKTLLCDELASKAVILISLKDFDAAKHCLKKAYKMRSPNKEEHDNITKMLKTCVGLCVSQNKLQEIDLDDFQERKVHLERIADGLSSLECYKLAIEYYLSTLDCMEKGGFSMSKRAPIYFSIAMTYVDMGDNDAAVQHFNQEMACNEKKPLERVKTLWAIAEVFKNQEKFGEGENAYLEALSLAQKVGDEKHHRRAFEKLLWFYQQNGVTDKAQAVSMKLEKSGLESMLSDESEAEDPFGNICLSELSDGEDSDTETKNKPRPRRHIAKPAEKKNELGETPLHKACINGNFIMVKRLVETGFSVNAADHNGWTPLHEASNYGYFSIVAYLLDKGALINKRSGKKGEGITALHDAASNGHLDVVQFLLSRGASATITDKDNNTSLDALMDWKMNNLGDLDEHKLQICKKVEDDLRKRMKKAGIAAKDYEGDDFTSFLHEMDAGANQEHKGPEQQSRQSDSDEDSDQLERPISKRSRKMSSSSESDVAENIENRNSQQMDHSDWDTANYAQNEYQSVMTNLRRSAQTQPKAVIKSIENIPTLLHEEEVVSEWLIMDTKQPVKKQKRRKVSRLSVGTSKSSYNYLEPKDRSDILPSEEEECKETPVANSSQTPLSSTRGDFLVPSQRDSYKQPFFLRVRIDNQLFSVPILEDSCTMEWLTEEAARRYQEKNLRSPQINSILTIDGGSLSNKDVIKSILPNNTEVRCEIVKWNEPTLEERYVHGCKKMKLVPVPSIQKELLQFNISKEVNLSNRPIDSKHVSVVFDSLSHFKTLRHLYFQGTMIISSNVQSIISSLPSFVSLVTLDLSCCALFTDTLGHLSEYCERHTDPFPCLETLLLDRNLFCMPCSAYVTSLLHIPTLKILGLSNCNLDTKIFEDLNLCQTLESCKNLQRFNVSDNPLSDTSLINLLHHFPKENLTKLDLSQTTKQCVDFGTVLKDLISFQLPKLRELSLENCGLTDKDLSLLTTPKFLTNLPQLKSLNLSVNPNLSSNSIINFLKVGLKREQPLDVYLVGTCEWDVKSIDELNDQIDFACLRSLTLETNVGREKVFDGWRRCWGRKATCLDSVFCTLSLSNIM